MNKADKKVYRMDTLRDLYNYLEKRIEHAEMYDLKNYQERIEEDFGDDYAHKELSETRERIEIIKDVQNEILKLM